MVRALRKRYGDRFSHYFDPQEFQQFEQANSGRFSGVGLTVTEVKRGLRVASVLPRTPAERAGIEPGDLIVAVDGRSIAGVSPRSQRRGSRARPARRSSCGWSPARSRRARNVRLERATVQVPVAQGELERAGGTKVAYVRFTTFSEGAHGELSSTLERLEKRGAEGLVLDLRGNGGGLLNEAVLCASLFLDKGQLVVSTNSRTMGHRDYEAVGDPLPRRPTVVLINHDTASAAEILASALADHHRATIVGTRSFGKGTFQEVLDLDAGGALDLTVGEYLTADGSLSRARGYSPMFAPRTIRGPTGTRDWIGARGAGGEGGGREQVSPRRAERSGGGSRASSGGVASRWPSRCSNVGPRWPSLGARST